MDLCHWIASAGTLPCPIWPSAYVSTHDVSLFSTCFSGPSGARVASMFANLAAEDYRMLRRRRAPLCSSGINPSATACVLPHYCFLKEPRLLRQASSKPPHSYKVLESFKGGIGTSLFLFVQRRVDPVANLMPDILQVLHFYLHSCSSLPLSPPTEQQ